MSKISIYFVMGALLAALSGCGSRGGAEASAAMPGQQADFATVALGGRLFAQNCATCHGVNGQGAPNWRQLGADGFYPPPPLNGTGHAWHHPRAMLHYVIRNGSPGGQGKMPAWGDRLSDQQIDAIISWFQSKWPQQVYAAWHEMDMRAQRQ